MPSDANETRRRYPLDVYCREFGIALKGTGAQRTGRCPLPGHEDKNPSFSVNVETGLFLCNGCGRSGDVLTLHALRKGWDPKTDFLKVLEDLGGGSAAEEEGPGVPVAEYNYRDEAGALLFQVVRYSPKTFRGRHKGPDGKWVWNVRGCRIVPYRLEELAGAADEVWVTEGEKDVETLRRFKLVASCNPFGAKNWRAEFAPYFKGKVVYLCPDADEEGAGLCLAAGRSLAGVAREVRVVTLPAGFKDASELYDAGPEAFIERLTAAYNAAEPFADLHAPGGNGEKPPPAPPAFDFALYDERRFNEDRLHEKPIPVFSLCGQAVATTGNMAAIYAQAKAGKSAVISALMATVMAEDENGDYLGFNAAWNPDGKALIHIDTEQSRYDNEQVVLRAVRRASCNRTPAWVRSYCLTDLGIPERRKFIAAETERAARECGGIYAVLIDGVGNFVPDVNDTTKTHEFIVELNGLAIKYETVEVLVLHENPAGKSNDHDKMRGHLGSQLERKAESNIRIVKSPKDGTCTVYTEKSRHANIPKEKGVRFGWDEAAQTHVSIPEGEDPANEDDREVVREMFNCPEALGGLTWSEAHARIREIEGLKQPGARKRFAKYTKLKLIIRNPNDKDRYIENPR